MTTTEAAADSPTSIPVIGSLSPSRAGDFMTCPLLYRFRVIDRIPERPSPAAVRGTLVHAVLERLFDLPAAGRTVPAALDLLGPQWERLLGDEPALATMFEEAGQGAGGQAAGGQGEAEWLGQAREMVERYFTLEDPRLHRPAGRGSQR
jgi:putative RecB family exonuclease